MSGDAVAARSPEPGRGATELCVLLACFGGAGRAAKLRRGLDKQIAGAGGRILDQVVLRVSGKRKAMVYDPRRVLAGTLTPGLTWGIFGLIAGGVSGFGIWAIVGAVCGGLFAYYPEHLATKDELRRLGRHLPRQSSAILAFVHGGSGEGILSSVAGSSPVTASVAAIGSDLSAQVLAGPGDPVVNSSVPAGGGPVPVSSASMLSMLLMRYRGKDTARQTAAKATHEPGTRGQSVQPELLIEVPQHGRPKVVAPTKLGVAAFAKTDTISWGLFGLVYGVIVGAVGNNGALGGLAYSSGQLFREGFFQFITSFSLPLYAIVGAQAGVKAGVPVAGVLALAVIGPTAGRWYVDVSSGVPPKQFIRGEWFVTIALLTGVIWVICDSAGLPVWASALIAFAIGYTVRMLALYYAWEEPLAKEPRGVYLHDDGRPMLGRKLKGKSKREMAMLGLAVSPADHEGQ